MFTLKYWKLKRFNIFILNIAFVLGFMSFSAYGRDTASAVPDSEGLIQNFGYIWIAFCTALIFFMQLGFALLESGMVRAKNTINVIMKNFADIGLGTLGFWMFGYGIMFGYGSFDDFKLEYFTPRFTDLSRSMDLIYQMMFAATAATIVSGAVAERIRFLPYIFGAFLITTLIYPVFGEWAWGGTAEHPGWLKELGFHDVAGSTVVHSVGAWCALGAIMVLGPRFGRYSRKGQLHDIPGHNLPYVAFGGLILWFGWFGFNGGSVNKDLSNLGQILLVTQLGAAGGICGAIFWMALQGTGLRITLAVNGGLAGLVSITAGANVFEPQMALLSGVIGGIIVVTSTNLLNRWKIDDVVGAIPVHGFCGAWGTLAVGLFYPGDMFNFERIITQIVGIVAAFIWGLSSSYVVFFILNKLNSSIRVPTKFEQRGLDVSEHHEIGYADFMTTQVGIDVLDKEKPENENAVINKPQLST
ncbi:MAG: ammonium transporter [Gammaproteobacteria bacterium]